MHKELLLEIIQTWNDDQLFIYIKELEKRVQETSEVIKDLRQIQRKRRRKPTYETGARDGR
jgi:hypothetical protein